MAKFVVRSFSAATAVVASLAVSAIAYAQDSPPTSNSAYIPKAMDEIFFGNTGSYNINRSIGGELDFMFGTSGFRENGITQDAYDIFEAYNYLLYEQTQADPTIRVPDLMNPFDTSVQFLPTGSSTNVSGSEFVFE
jgi:hypothetical protein